MTIYFATVCSGIGAPEVAWRELPGWRSVFGAEIEAFPRAVLVQRHGMHDARLSGRGAASALFGDLTAIRVRHLRRLGIPLPDVMIAGTPCQAFSIAGGRRGLNDARGNITLQFVRLCHAIHNARIAAGLPGLVVAWENVPGVYSDTTNAFGCFLGAMVGADSPLIPPGGLKWTRAGMVAGPLGTAAWVTRDAQYFGLAQRRERCLAVFCFGDGPDPSEILFEPESLRRHSRPRREAGEKAASPVASSAEGGSGYRLDADTTDNLVAADVVGALQASGKAAGSATQQDAESGMLVAGTLHASTPKGDGYGRADQLVAFGGNNTSGTIDVATARTGHAGPHGRLDFETETFIADFGPTHALRAEGFDASEGGTGRGTPLVPVERMQQPYSIMPMNSGRDFKARKTEIAQPLTAGNPDRGAQGGDVVAAFNSREDPICTGDIAGSLGSSSPQAQAIAFNLRGREGGAMPEVDSSGDAAALRSAEGGSTRSMIAFSTKDHGADAQAELSPTLRAMQHASSHANGGSSIGNADAAMQTPTSVGGVRRLIPRECERLQGFPDDFTLVPFRSARAQSWRPRSGITEGLRIRIAETNKRLQRCSYAEKHGEVFALPPVGHSHDDAVAASDGPRYRALGNSMAVPKIRWLGQRIDMVIRKHREKALCDV